MSDPNDPYRSVDIGGGVNPFGESIEGLGEVEVTLSKTEEVLVSIANQLSGISEQLGGFAPVAKEMTKSKFVKSSKSLTDMFKSIGIASPQATAIQAIFKVLKPLMDLFKPFLVILDILGALVSAMVGEALKPMFEAMQPLFDALLDLLPVFVELGKTLGEALAPIITVLVDLFIQLLPVIMPIITAIVELMAKAMKPLSAIISALIPIIIPLVELALTPLKIALDLLSPILDLLTPYIDDFADAMEVLSPIIETVTEVIGFLIEGAFKAFMIAIFWVGETIFAIIDALTFGEVPGRGDFRDFFADLFRILDIDLPGFLEGRGTEGGGGTGIPPGMPIGGGAGGGPGAIPALQEGAIALSQGVYELAEGGQAEAVIPLTKWEKSISRQNALLGIIHDELVTQSFYNRQLVRNKEWKIAFNL